MTAFELFGAPFPGFPANYRGTERRSPLVKEELGLSHPANQALLQMFEAGYGDDRPIADIEVARRLAREYRPELDVGWFELVEVTRSGEHPQAGDGLLGYDVPFEGGGHTSLLAMILLYEGESSGGRDGEEGDERVATLRQQFAHRLNEHLLFAVEEDAAEFLAAAIELGPWEGPGIDWEVVGLWLVPDR
jgi:hypothetical protein